MLPLQPAALLKLPFELFSVTLLIHDGTHSSLRDDGLLDYRDHQLPGYIPEGPARRRQAAAWRIIRPQPKRHLLLFSPRGLKSEARIGKVLKVDDIASTLPELLQSSHLEILFGQFFLAPHRPRSGQSLPIMGSLRDLCFLFDRGGRTRHRSKRTAIPSNCVWQNNYRFHR
jgi:hypothetical protein